MVRDHRRGNRTAHIHCGLHVGADHLHERITLDVLNLSPGVIDQWIKSVLRAEKSARECFIYYSGATLSAVRYKNWKVYYSMTDPDSLWFHLTFDLQAVQSDVKARDTALVLGLRAKVDF